MDLIDAAALLAPSWPDLRVAIVGDGPLLPALRDRAAVLGIAGRVHLPGFRDDVPDLLPALDAFAFPSREEGLGSALLEAMAAGVPVVATRAGGIPEVVRDGVDGLLVPPADPPALAAALDRILRDPAAADRRAASARARVAAEFAADRMVAETLRHYLCLVGRWEALGGRTGRPAARGRRLTCAGTGGASGPP